MPARYQAIHSVLYYLNVQASLLLGIRRARCLSSNRHMSTKFYILHL